MRVELQINKALLLESIKLEEFDLNGDMNFGEVSDTAPVKTAESIAAEKGPEVGSTLKEVKKNLGDDYHKDPTKLQAAKDIGNKSLGVTDTAPKPVTTAPTTAAKPEGGIMSGIKDKFNSLSSNQKIGAGLAAGGAATGLAAATMLNKKR